MKKRSFKRILVNLLVTLVVGFVYFFFKLPAINLQDQEFYSFFFVLAVVYIITAVITAGIWREQDRTALWKGLKHHCLVPILLCAALIVFSLVGWLISSVIFRASDYEKLITIEEGDFIQDVEEISFDQIPMLDKDSAEKLGDRKLGELSDMVSQFEVSSDYAQINYQDRPVRVTYLQYGDLIKWFNNRGSGYPAYIRIDMVTQNVEVVRLPEGMKYSTDEHLMRNLYRHLRFQFPTFMFNQPNFEIDEEGHPYWICPRIVKTIGLFGGTDIKGAVLVDAVTGESTYYEEVPSWVDRVYSADLIVEQYDYHGMYQGGFINSIFGQKGVTVTTEGYNYIALNDDVYVYTGITSVGGDQSNVGFILTNQRTKETKYYPIAGAAEYSATGSAEGVVQHLNYKATFPLLLNIHKQPTYFMALKDNAGLVKMYAMVNVQQYQIVATGSTLSQCEANYVKLLGENKVEGADTSDIEAQGVIDDLRSAVIDGNTVFYFRLQGESRYYQVSAAEEEQAVLLNVGDRVKLTYSGAEDASIVAVLTMEIQ